MPFWRRRDDEATPEPGDLEPPDHPADAATPDATSDPSWAPDPADFDDPPVAAEATPEDGVTAPAIDEAPSLLLEPRVGSQQSCRRPANPGQRSTPASSGRAAGSCPGSADFSGPPKPVAHRGTTSRRR